MENRSLETPESKKSLYSPPLSLLIVVILTHAWPTAHFEVVPDITLPMVYYWGVFQPRTLLVPSFLFIGLLEDILLGAFFGTTALVWLITYFATQTQRKFLGEKGFLIIWIGFSIICLVAYGVKSFIYIYASDKLPSLNHIFLSYLFTLALYPLVARCVLPLGRRKNV